MNIANFCSWYITTRQCFDNALIAGTINDGMMVYISDEDILYHGAKQFTDPVTIFMGNGELEPPRKVKYINSIYINSVTFKGWKYDGEKWHNVISKLNVEDSVSYSKSIDSYEQNEEQGNSETSHVTETVVSDITNGDDIMALNNNGTTETGDGLDGFKTIATIDEAKRIIIVLESLIMEKMHKVSAGKMGQVLIVDHEGGAYASDKYIGKETFGADGRNTLATEAGIKSYIGKSAITENDIIGRITSESPGKLSVPSEAAIVSTFAWKTRNAETDNEVI